MTALKHCVKAWRTPPVPLTLMDGIYLHERLDSIGGLYVIKLLQVGQGARGIVPSK